MVLESKGSLGLSMYLLYDLKVNFMHQPYAEDGTFFLNLQARATSDRSRQFRRQ